MSVNLTTLFTRLGLVGGTFNAINTSRGTTVPGYITDIVAQYAAPDLNLISDIWTQLASNQAANGSIQSYFANLAQQTVIQMVNEDTPLPSLDLNTALIELLAQMATGTATLQRPTVTAGSPAYGASNRGTGVLVPTVTDALGTMYTTFNETVSLRCTSDSSLGATNFNEPFTITTPATADPLSWLYPPGTAGSGINLSVNSVNPQVDNQQGNLLTNSDFESFTISTPNNWLITTGTEGQDILDGGSLNAYYGANCLEFSYYAGTPTSAINQPFNNSTTGTGGALLPDTAYAVAFHAKRTAGLSGAGALQVALVNAQTLAVVADDAGNNNVTTITASSGLSTSYAAKTAVFRTPRALPAAGLALQVKMSTAIADSGQAVYFDYLAMTPMQRLYGQGPLLAVFSGASPWAYGDTITAAMNNNYGGKFVYLTDKWFGLRSLGLAFPTASSPSISDALVTT